MLVTYSTIIDIKEGDTIFIDKAAVINDGEGADGETEYQIYDIYLEQLPIKFTMLPYEEPTPPGPTPTPDIDPNISTEYGYTLYDYTNSPLTTGVLKTDGTGLDIHSHIPAIVIYNGNMPSAEGNTFYYLDQYSKVDGMTKNTLYSSDGELQSQYLVLYQPEATQINPNSVNSYNYTLYDEYDMMMGSGVAETTGTGYDPSGHVELRSSGATLTYVNKYAKVDGMMHNAKYDSMGTLQTGKIVLSTYTPPTPPTDPTIDPYMVTTYNFSEYQEVMGSPSMMDSGTIQTTGNVDAYGHAVLTVLTSSMSNYGQRYLAPNAVVNGSTFNQMYDVNGDIISGGYITLSTYTPPTPPTPTYDIDPDKTADYSFNLYDTNSAMQIASGVVQSGTGKDTNGKVKLAIICLDGDFDGSQATLHGESYIGVNEDAVVNAMSNNIAYNSLGTEIGQVRLSRDPIANIDSTMTNQYNFTIYDNTNMVKETGVAQCNGMGYDPFGHVMLLYNNGNDEVINVNKYAKVDGMTHNSIYSESFGTLTTDTIVLSIYIPPQPTLLFSTGMNTSDTKANHFKINADGNTAYMMNNDLSYWSTANYSNCYIVASIDGTDYTFNYNHRKSSEDYTTWDFYNNTSVSDLGIADIEMHVKEFGDQTLSGTIEFILDAQNYASSAVSSLSNVRVYCTAGQSVSNSVQTDLHFSNNSSNSTIAIKWIAQDNRSSYGWKTSKTIDNMMSIVSVYPGEELLAYDENETYWMNYNITSSNIEPVDASSQINDWQIEITTYGSPASISISDYNNSD